MRRIMLCSIALIIVMTAGSQPTAVIGKPTINDVADFSPSAVIVTEMNSNNDLLEPPQLLKNGDSEEFSVWHSSSEISGDYGFVQLSWIHSSGVEIDTTGDDRDYVGCSISFEWPYEEIPRNVHLLIEMTTSTSGDFATFPASISALLSVYFIDSSGNWIPTPSNTLGYGYTAWDPIIAPEIIEDAFGGMIENTDGIQEDPSDSITVAVILEPNEHSFDSSYVGSFEAILHSISINTVRKAAPNEPVLSPGRKVTWRTTASNVDPDYAQYADSFYDSATDVITHADGSIYGLLQSSYSDFKSAVVLKWNEHMQLEWYYRIEDVYVEGSSLAVSEDAVYVAGYTHYYDNASDVVLTKLSHDGSLQWSRNYDYGNADSIRSAAADDDGLVYVLVNTGLGSDRSNLTLAQFNQEGMQNWATSIPGVFGYKVACTSDGRIYTHDSDCVREWDSTGKILRNGSVFGTWMLGPGGSVYGINHIRTTDDAYYLRIVKEDGDGVQLWNTTYRIHYSLEKNETIIVEGCAVSNNGSLFISVYLHKLALESRLLHFNANTSAFIESRLLTEESKRESAYNRLTIGADGYLYGFRTIEKDVVLYSYSPPAAGFWGVPLSLESLVLLGGIGVVLVLAVVLFKRKGSA